MEMCFHDNQHPWAIKHPFISLHSNYQSLKFFCPLVMNSPIFPSLDDIYCKNHRNVHVKSRTTFGKMYNRFRTTWGHYKDNKHDFFCVFWNQYNVNTICDHTGWKSVSAWSFGWTTWKSHLLEIRHQRLRPELHGPRFGDGWKTDNSGNVKMWCDWWSSNKKCSNTQWASHYEKPSFSEWSLGIPKITLDVNYLILTLMQVLDFGQR